MAKVEALFSPSFGTRFVVANRSRSGDFIGSVVVKNGLRLETSFHHPATCPSSSRLCYSVLLLVNFYMGGRMIGAYLHKEVLNGVVFQLAFYAYGLHPGTGS